MAETVRPMFPEALYLDANALRATPPTLDTQPMAEIAAFASNYSMGLFVPELAAREWIAHRTEITIRAMRRVVGDSRDLGQMLDRAPPKAKVIDDEELRRTVHAVQMRRLTQAGFEIIQRPKLDLAELIDVFVAKKPPFDDGDRGFKDAVILETVFAHACTSNSFANIVLVTGDKRFGHPSIGERFLEAGTRLHCVQGPSKALLPQTVEKLNGMMKKAGAVRFRDLLQGTTSFAQRHQHEILDFAMENAQIGLSDIEGSGRAGVLEESSEADAKLKYARILSIDAIRPREVISAFPWLKGLRERTDGREGILITVAIEIDLTIARPAFARFRAPLADPSPLLVERRFASTRQDIQEPITVVRTITVNGSVSPEGFPDNLADLRLETA